MTNSNRPVYRYPPRSHVPNCPCPRCVQCRSRPQSAGIIGFDIGCLAVVLILAAIGAAISGFARLAGRYPHETLAGCGVVAAAVLFLVIRAGVRRDRTERAARRVPPAMPPAPPLPGRSFPAAPLLCTHPRAVPVDNDTLGRLAWWCPACDTQLPPAWEPATAPPPPPPPVPVAAVPGGRWAWELHCTCRKSNSGTANSEPAAKAFINMAAAAHQKPGHRYEYTWRAL